MTDTTPTREWQMPGWRLVPVEPTEEMLVAGQEAWMCTHANRPAIEDCEQSVAVWAAMLAAAPKAPPMPELPEQRKGQPLVMTITGDSIDGGHWLSPDYVREYGRQCFAQGLVSAKE